MSTELRLQNALTGEIRVLVVSDQLADRILNAEHPPVTGNWVPVR
jgi:hypothetical protein